jgi:serine O-acetyltransferase
MVKLDAIIDGLQRVVNLHPGEGELSAPEIWPSKQGVRELTDELVDVLFIERLHAAHRLEAAVRKACKTLRQLLSREIAASLHQHSFTEGTKASTKNIEREAEEIALELLAELPQLKLQLEKDAEAAFRGDPAAKSVAEVHLSYPGFFAIAVHRIAHSLYVRKVPLLPRMMAEDVHGRTGIDIHPGATIGESFFIDHGTGVVIGETTWIGPRVKLYQGVTLGALSIPDRFTPSGQRRHPTIEEDVTIYAGATILGGDAVIGKGSVIGGNVWLTQSIPPYTKVYNGAPSLVYEDIKGPVL